MIIEAVKRMGAGMVERHGERPGRTFDSPAFTIRAFAGGMEPGGFVWKMADGSKRRMTPTEAAALQGYPADFALGGPAVAQFAGVGNAVPPLLAEAILKELWS